MRKETVALRALRASPPLLLTALVFFAAGCQTSVGNYFANRTRDFGECFRLQVGFGPGIGAHVQAAGVAHFGPVLASVPRELGMGWDYGEGYFFSLGRTGMTWDNEMNLILGYFNMTTGRPPPFADPYGDERPKIYAVHWSTRASSRATLNPLYADHGCLSIVPGAYARVRDPTESESAGSASLGRISPGEISEVTPSLTLFGPTLDETEDTPEAKEPEFIWSEDASKEFRWAQIHAYDLEMSLYLGVAYAKVGFSLGEFADFVLGWFGADIARDDRSLERTDDENQ